MTDSADQRAQDAVWTPPIRVPQGWLRLTTSSQPLPPLAAGMSARRRLEERANAKRSSIPAPTELLVGHYWQISRPGLVYATKVIANESREFPLPMRALPKETRRFIFVHVIFLHHDLLPIYEAAFVQLRDPRRITMLFPAAHAAAVAGTTDIQIIRRQGARGRWPESRKSQSTHSFHEVTQY
ncbi:hypothetical protein LY76DRAFT_86665 [Colletotrichum caudatum]|nr:hypothetical protein LY76DRAFT_86665 [Colletotrichum caudatum]